MVVSLAARLAATAGKAGLAGLGGLRAARPFAEKAGSAAVNLLKNAGNQGSRFIRGAKQPAGSVGRPLTGSSAEIGRKAASAAGGLGQVGKALADDIANITRSVLQGAGKSVGKSNTAAQAAAVQKAIITKYPGAGEVAAKVAARVRSGKTTLAGLDITGALKSSPAFLQTLGANTRSGIQTLANSPMAQKVAGSRIGQGSKNLFNKANVATNPATANPAADAAFGSVLAQGRNIGSQIGSGLKNQYGKLTQGIQNLRNPNTLENVSKNLRTHMPTGYAPISTNLRTHMPVGSKGIPTNLRTHMPVGSKGIPAQFPKGAYTGPKSVFNTTSGSTQLPYGNSMRAYLDGRGKGFENLYTSETMAKLGIPAAETGGLASLLSRIPGAGLFTGSKAASKPSIGLLERGVPTYGVKDFIPSVGGTLGAAGRAAKGIGSFSMKHPFIATGLGTAGVMYGPDAYDAATTAMFGKSPEQQFRQGVGSLMGTEENRRRTLGDLGALYAQGELGEAIGTPGARNLSQQQMRQYLGGSIFGDEGYANIPMRGGSSIFGGEGSPTMAGDIFNNPARESIMKNFGMQMDDEEIMEKYAEILDKQRRKKSLDAEDLQFLMMFEALSKPTNLPSDQFRRNQGFETQRAYNDVQNQLGGQFEVIDYNELYPTYAQPQTAINMADGGVANLMDGGAANGPGTGTSDSIPARLSDGEFVMTSDAVRGMGDGSRKDGVRKMYDLMNSLEAK